MVITFQEFTLKISERYGWTNLRIICNQQYIELGQLMQEEFDSVLRKIKNRKAEGRDEIPPEVWREFNDILLRHSNAVYNQNTIGRWTKEYILLFPKESD